MKPIAVAVADLHLTLQRPVSRVDKDWLGVQAHYLQQLKRISKGLPILCAGDIFDRWNTPPELINFALKELPDGMFCVPGQHDLPYHRMDLMHRSGYGVLVQTGKIVHLDGPSPRASDCPFNLYGYGWGQQILPPQKSPAMQIAVVHRYVWTVETRFPGASEESHLFAVSKKLRNYHTAIFGDNHKGFLKQLKHGCTVLNCGGFIRRKSDELDYRPSVGLIYEDGTVERKFLDLSIDVFEQAEEETDETPLDVRAFIALLNELGEQGLDFKQAVQTHLQKEDVSAEVREIVLQALEAKTT